MTWIYTCSTNPGKMVEFELIGHDACLAGYQIAPLPDLREIKAPEETGATFEANAELKAQYYSRFTSELVLADDSGLEVSALDGAPGVYSARYGGPDATDEQNNDLLLANMAGIADRRACFVCVIAIAKAGKTLYLARGTVEGELLTSRRGSGGFGYDPLFYYPPLAASFGELTREQKLMVSHRGNALRQIASLLKRA